MTVTLTLTVGDSNGGVTKKTHFAQHNTSVCTDVIHILAQISRSFPPKSGQLSPPILQREDRSSHVFRKITKKREMRYQREGKRGGSQPTLTSVIFLFIILFSSVKSFPVTPTRFNNCSGPKAAFFSRSFSNK